jgi:hypothetical protein
MGGHDFMIKHFYQRTIARRSWNGSIAKRMRTAQQSRASLRPMDSDPFAGLVQMPGPFWLQFNQLAKL